MLITVELLRQGSQPKKIGIGLIHHLSVEMSLGRKFDGPVFRSNFFGLALASLSVPAGLPWTNRLVLADKVVFFARQQNRKMTDKCAIDLERQSFVGYLKAITTSKRMTGLRPFIYQNPG